MLSNKWTFSLTSLVVMLSLCFVASSAMAQFEIGLSVDDDVDVSYADGNHVVYGVGTTIRMLSAKVVNFDATANAETAARAAENSPIVSGTALGADDFTIIAYNKFGGTVADAPVLGFVGTVGAADGLHFMAVLTQVTAPNVQTPAPATEITRVLIVLPKETVELADPRAEIAADGTRKPAGQNKETSIELLYVGTEPTGADSTVTPEIPNAQPRVHSIVRPGDVLLPVTAATFDVLITLSEDPRKDGFKAAQIDVSNATAGDPVLLRKYNDDDGQTEAGMLETGRDNMLYEYVVTITPKYENKNDIVVKIKMFYDQEKVDERKYTPPVQATGYEEGDDKLTVKVGKEVLKDKTAGIVVYLPENTIIPKDGYVVVVKDAGGSAVRDPGGADKSPVLTARQPFGLTYNRVAGTLPNLETLLLNGGTIDLVGPNSLIISEVMWGSDASIDAGSFNSQYIEIRNTSGAEIKAAKETYKLVFYTAGATLPDDSDAANNVQDRVGTVGASGYWSVAGKGQSGRSGVEEAPGDLAAVTPTQPLISMQRVIDATGVAADGTMASSWAASTPPSLNFNPDIEGVRIGSPGRAPVAYPTAPVVAPPAPTVAVAMPADIMITEIMVDTGGGRLPQWIELSNVSGKAVSLAGWSVLISNSAADDDVVGASVSINLSGTLDVSAHTGNTGKGQSLLLVAWGARSSGQINADLVMNVSSQVGETGRYTLISEMGFMVALVPPQTTGVLTYGDAAGNLDEAWELPTADGARSSLIRREADALGAATMGTMANGWVLASDTALVSGPATWYGSDEDAGTPGYDAGGPLPVQLSHFRPARDKETGAAVITWSTQSELNNAGFFIKRSQQRDGQFKIINAAMIQGAGTISEKQFYTYTDTTAQPNVVYYYQIEDVSLDGNRQTLTNGIRLKGHIGAAGKLTTLWGDLKTQE